MRLRKPRLKLATGSMESLMGLSRIPALAATVQNPSFAKGHQATRLTALRRRKQQQSIRFGMASSRMATNEIGSALNAEPRLWPAVLDWGWRGPIRFSIVPEI